MTEPPTAVLPPPSSHDVPEDVYASWSATASPDGEHVAFVSDRSGEPRAWIESPGPGGTPQARVVAGAPSRLLSVSWSPDGAWLACVAASAVGARQEIWVVRPDGTDVHLVAGGPGMTAALGLGPWHGWTAGSELIVTETDRSASSCLLVDPATGGRSEVVRAPLHTLLDLDREGRRALLLTGPRGVRRLELFDRSDASRRPLGQEPGTVVRGGFALSGACVVAVTDAGRDLPALLRFDVPSGATTVLLSRADAGAEDVVLTEDGATAVVLWNVLGGTSAVSLADVRSGAVDDVAALPRSVVDDCRLLPGGKRLLLTAESWADPRGVWALDLPDGPAIPLSSPAGKALRASYGASSPTVDVGELTRPRLLTLPAHDGLELSGWFYPPDSPPPWPAVLWLHGGPESQERPVYNSLFQSLVAAGVAVFAPNVRGSSGFGRSFLMADDRERRFDAIEDVATCARYLVDAGVAQQGRLGCLGRSYGGYLTLAALTWFPDLFAVGVDVCGMADFVTFYEHTEPWIGAAAFAEYGHPVADAALLRELSPLHRIDALRTPLLVVHGSQDTNVPVKEAEQVVAALRERGRRHRYLCFEGEGHELLRTENRVTFVRETVEWVRSHLAPLPTPQG